MIKLRFIENPLVPDQKFECRNQSKKTLNQYRKSDPKYLSSRSKTYVETDLNHGLCFRSMSEVMVDYGYSEQVHEARSGYSGRTSTYSQAVSSTADRSGTEIMETDHYIEASSASAAYYQQAGSYREERR